MSTEEKKETKKIATPKKTKHKLKSITNIDGKQKLPGDTVELTEEGRKSFKRKNRI